jgi:hypothetical protein
VEKIAAMQRTLEAMTHCWDAAEARAASKRRPIHDPGRGPWTSKTRVEQGTGKGLQEASCTKTLYAC